MTSTFKNRLKNLFSSNFSTQTLTESIQNERRNSNYMETSPQKFYYPNQGPKINKSYFQRLDFSLDNYLKGSKESKAKEYFNNSFGEGHKKLISNTTSQSLLNTSKDFYENNTSLTDNLIKSESKRKSSPTNFIINKITPSVKSKFFRRSKSNIRRQIDLMQKELGISDNNYSNTGYFFNPRSKEIKSSINRPIAKVAQNGITRNYLNTVFNLRNYSKTKKNKSLLKPLNSEHDRYIKLLNHNNKYININNLFKDYAIGKSSLRNSNGDYTTNKRTYSQF